MLERVLDKYYAKKCIKEIEKYVYDFVDLDIKSKKSYYGYALFVKKEKYKDYIGIGTIPYREAFKTFIRLDEYKAYIKREIDYYLRNN